MFRGASGCVLPHQKIRPTTCTTEDCSEISIELSIKEGIGAADGTPLSRSISGTQDPHAGCIRRHHWLRAQICSTPSQPSRNSETTKPAGTSLPLRTRSPTSPTSCLESGQSDLRQTADPFPPHPCRGAGAARASAPHPGVPHPTPLHERVLWRIASYDPRANGDRAACPRREREPCSNTRFLSAPFRIGMRPNQAF